MSLTSRALVLSWILLVFPAAGWAQQVHVVPAGSNLQAAVDAAASGDVLLLKAGDYGQYSDGGFIVSGKPLSVMSEGGYVSIHGAITVSGLSEGQSVTLRGLEVECMYTTTPALTLANNSGPVWVEACGLFGDGDYEKVGLAAVVVNCVSVTFQRCQIEGAPGGWGWLVPGSLALRMSASAVSLFDSTCWGGAGSPSLGGYPKCATPGGAGASLESGSFFASGSTFRGGNGGQNSVSCGTSQMQGGPGLGVSPSGSVTWLACTFAGGSGGTVPTRGIVGSGVVQEVPGTARSFEAAVAAVSGEPIPLHFRGIPGERVGVLAGNSMIEGMFLDGTVGLVLVDLDTAQTTLFGAVPADGMLAARILAPSLPPSVEGQVLYLQSLFIDPNFGSMVYGPASAGVVTALP